MTSEADSEPRSELDPRAVAEEFFERMAYDDRRETIGELFADDVMVTVPGDQFQGLDAPAEMLDFFGPPRYEWADKEFDRWIESTEGNGGQVVSIGHLYGVDSDGEEFAAVRYVDVYEIRDGLIHRLDIWNDLAVEGVVE